MTKQEVVDHLYGLDDELLFAKSEQVKSLNIGSKVYLRGLIEISNICIKDCLYCGIRKSNSNVDRYQLTFKEVCQSIDFAIGKNFGSVVIQAGERSDEAFILLIKRCLKYAKEKSEGRMGITLSLGEQEQSVYDLWKNEGAHRYLLRIESSSNEIYNKIHPEGYSWNARLEAIERLRKAGYQVGTGVMIGLPFQTIDDLADDLLFMQRLDIDMCGMGPYIEHFDTPLSKFESQFTHKERVALTLRMIALLRILMPKINIASTTALQTLDNQGFKKGLTVGANIMMPNITPDVARKNYNLYQNKPYSTIDLSQFDVAYGEWGDSIHYSLKSF